MAKKKKTLAVNLSNSSQRAQEYADAYRKKRKEDRTFVSPLANNKDYRTQQAKQFAENIGMNPTTDKQKTGRDRPQVATWADGLNTNRRNSSDAAPSSPHIGAGRANFANFANSSQRANSFADRFMEQRRNGTLPNRENSLYDLARRTVEDRERDFRRQAAKTLGLSGAPLTGKGLQKEINRANYDYMRSKGTGFNTGLRKNFAENPSVRSKIKDFARDEAERKQKEQEERIRSINKRAGDRKDTYVQLNKREPIADRSVDPRTEYRQRPSQPRHQYTQEEGQKLIADYLKEHPGEESSQGIRNTNAMEMMQVRENAMQYLMEQERERRRQGEALNSLRRQTGREGNISDAAIRNVNQEDIGRKTFVERAKEYLRHDPSGSQTANFGDVLYPSLHSTGNPMEQDLDKKFGIDRMGERNLSAFAAAGRTSENNPLIAAEQASQGAPIQADRAQSYIMMTRKEKQNYNAILARDGLAKAEEYHDALMDDINKRIAQRNYLEGTKDAGTIPNALYTLSAGLGQGLRGVGELGNLALGTSNTKATPVSEYLAEDIRTNEDNTAVQNAIYDIAQSTGNMIPGIVTSAFLGPQAGSAVFAFSQAGNAYRDAINAGETTSTASLYGLQQGVDEMATNFLLGGIGAFGGGEIKRIIQEVGGDAFTRALDRVVKTPAGRQILSRVMDYVSDMGSEAAQEYVQFFTENWTQAFLGMKDKDGNPVAANFNPLDPNALYAALLGGLNAGVLNVPQIAGRVSSASRADVSDAAATAEYINRDLDITNYTEEDLDKAIRLADIAEDIKQKQEQGQKVSALEKTAYISAAEDVIESNSFRETEESKREEAYKAARENLAEGFGEEGKKAFNENIAEENRIEAYKPFAAYYNYGYHGTPVSRDMEKAAFQTMSSEQIDAAMRAGAADANRDHPIEVTNRVQKAVEGIEIKAVKAGNIDTSSINMNRLTSQQRFRVQYAGALISKGLGLDVKFIESRAEGGVYRGINGSFQVINGRPTVTLDVNAGMNRISDWTGELGDIQKMLPIISHELTHYLEKTDSAMYKEISDAIITELSKNRNYTKGLTINQMISAERNRMDRNETRYDESGNMIPHSNDDAMREIVARACEDMLNGNETATKAFEGMSKRTKKYVWDHVKKVFDNIQDFFRQMLGTYESTSREAQAIRENMEAYEEIRKKWQQALGFATENLARQDVVRAENISMETEQAETAEKVVPAAEVVETNVQDSETAREAFSIRQFAQALDFDLRLNAEGFPFEIIDPKTGKAVKKVTEEHMRQTPMGYLIEAARQNNTIDKATADKQLKMFADLMNLTLKYDSASTPMVWEIAGSMMFSSVKSNSDAQYATTVDYGTICAKTQGLIDVLSKTMVEKGRGLTRKEVIDAYNATAHNGLSVPCPVCYVFSRWMGVPSLLETMRQCQVRFENASEKEVKKYINTMLDRYGDAKGVNSRKTAIQNQAAKLDRDLQAAMQKGDLEEQRRIEKKCDQLEKELRDVESFNWVTQVRCVSDKKGGYKLDPSYKSVPNEILLDLTRTGDFASKYAKSWKYRVTRGAGMGKAIMPYSGATIGDFIKGNKTKWEKAKNVFFKKDIKAAKTAVKRANTRAKAQNLIGGQRFQSTSDFRAEWGIDYLMTFLECQAAGSQVQLYTKVIEAVDMFATAGAEVNLSIMPKDNGYVGNKLVFSDVTGINFNEALKKTRKYDNVQMILVGINDKHIRLALKDKRISFVIPWHPSGSSKETLSALMTAVNENLSDAKSYEDSQNDKIIDNSEEMVKMRKLREDILMRKIGTLSDEQQEMLDRNPWLNDLYRRFYLDKTAKEYEVKLNKKQISSLFPYEYWDTSLTIEDADENGRRFQEYCASLGYQPRFSQFANDEGYWKLLIDRRMYNNDGTYHDPQAIDVTNVKVSSIPQAVNSNNYKDVDKIAQATRDTLRAIDNEQNDLEVIEEEETNREQYSSRDSDGNELTEGQQEYFADSKARDRKGNLVKVYHGGTVENIFDTGRGAGGDTEFGPGAYFTDSEYYAKEYTEYRGGKVKEYYINLTNPYDNRKKFEDGPEWDKVKGILTERYGINDKDLRVIKNWGMKTMQEVIDRYTGTKQRGFFTNVNEANAILREAGYDGVIAEYNDVLQYVVFNPNQAKLTTNQNPTANPDIQYASRDSEYMDAVSSGNMEAAERMVRAAAKEAGYSLELYHGSRSYGFTIFDIEKTSYGTAFFATTDPEIAETYSGEKGVREVGKPKNRKREETEGGNYHLFAKAENLLRVDAKGRRWYKIRTKDIKDRVYKVSGIDVASGLMTLEEAKDFARKIARRMGESGILGLVKTVKTKARPFRNDMQLVSRKTGKVILELEDLISTETTTDNLAKYAKDAGYSGIEIKNVIAMGPKADLEGDDKKADIYAFFDTSQLKSADPVTYDDNGEVIPLSERFNTEKPDIRYASRDVDAFDLWQEVVAERNDAEGRDSVFFMDDDDPTKVTYQQQEFMEELSKNSDTVMAMNAALHQAIGEGKQVDVAKFAAEQARKLRTEYGSKIKKADLQDAIESLCKKMNKAVQKDANDIAIAASNIGREVMDGVMYVDDTMKQMYPNLQREIKSYRLAPSSTARGDMAAAYDSYESFRRRAFGRLTLVNEESSNFIRVDSAYQELSEKYPDLFPADTINESEQLLRILEVANDLSGVRVKGVEALGMAGSEIDAQAYMIGQDILGDFYRAAGQPAFGGVLETVRDDLKTRYHEEIRELRYRKNAKIAELQSRIAELEADNDELLAKEREKLHTEKIEALIRQQQRNQEEIEKLRKEMLGEKNKALSSRQLIYNRLLTKMEQKKLNREARARLLSQARILARMKGGPDFEARKAELIGQLDLISTGMRSDTRAKLEEFRTRAQKLAAEDENYAGLNYKAAEAVFSRLSKKHISTMTGKDIADLTEKIVELIHMEQDSKRMLNKEIGIQVSTVAKTGMDQQKRAKGINERNALGAAIGKYTLNMLNPTRAMAMLDGYAPDGVLKKLGDALNDGQTKMNDFIMKSNKKFDGFLEKHRELADTWYVNNIDTGLKDKDGKPIYINKGMRISLYLHSLNNQNMNHIAGAGISIPDAEMYRKGKYSIAYRYSQNVRLMPTDIKEITSHMTEDEKAFAELARTFLNKDTKDAINETSMVLNGTLKAGVDNYFPIRTDTDFVMRDVTGLIQDATIEGMGMLKERVMGAKTPILLEDVAVVIQRQTQNTARYYGLAIPVRDFNKIFKWKKSAYVNDYKEDGTKKTVYEKLGENPQLGAEPEGFRKSIRRTWGDPGIKYIEGVLKDIQTGGHGEEGPGARMFSSLKSTYAGTVLNWNLGVSIKQSASAPFAAVVLDAKSVAKAFAGTNFFKPADLEYMDSITPWSYMRREGSSGTEMGEVYKQKNMIQKSGKIQWLKNHTNFIQAVDVWTTNRLFLATEYYVQDHFPKLEKRGPEYNQKVAELYNDMLQRTQPSYDVMQRNAFLRSDSPATKVFGMFKTQTFNMGAEVIDAWGRLTAYYKMHKDKLVSDDQLKQVRGQFGKTVGATIVSQLMLTALGVLAKAVYHNMKNYRDDEGRVTPESIIGRTIYEFLTSFSGMTMGGSDVQSIVLAVTGAEKWYDLEYPGLSSINDMITNATKMTDAFGKAAENGWKPDKAQAFKKSCIEFAMSAAILGRIPADNLYKIGNALYLHVQDIKAGKPGSFESGDSLFGLRDSNVTKDQYANRAAAAYKAGDTEAGDKWSEKTTEKKLQKAMYGDQGIDEDSSKAMVEYVKAGGDAADFEKGKSLGKELEEKDIKGDEVYAFVVDSKDYSNQEKIAWFKSSTTRAESKKYTAWKNAGYGDWDFLKYRSDLSKFSGDGKQEKIVNYIKTQTTDTKKRKALWLLAGYKESSFDKNMK